MQTKRCPRCDEVKDFSEFVKNRSTKDGLASYCKPCFREYAKQQQAKNPEKTREYKRNHWARLSPERKRERKRRTMLKAQYGLTVEQYEAMHAAQDGKCAICQQEPTNERKYDLLYVDHDHVSGRARGLLCQNCNFAIGMFKDDDARMERAIAYIRRFRLQAVEEKGN